MEKILIDEQLCAKIEMLHYEVESRKEIISNFLATATGDSAINNMFKSYQNEYREYFIEYNKAKQEMLDTYNVNSDGTWNLDFDTRELTIK